MKVTIIPKEWKGNEAVILKSKEYTFCLSVITEPLFAHGPGDRGSIAGRVIPKTQKMELDTVLLNTQHYKVKIKGEVV